MTQQPPQPSTERQPDSSTFLHEHPFFGLLLLIGSSATIVLWISTWEEPHWFDASRVGSAGTWFSGIVTAVSIAFVASRQVSMRRDQQRVEAARQWENQIAQAAKVTGWVVQMDRTPRVNHPGEYFWEVTVRITNSSDSAIYSPLASVGESVDKSTSFVGGSRRLAPNGLPMESVLPPGESVDQIIRVGFVDDQTPTFPPGLLIQFVDSAGRFWSRTNGELSIGSASMRDFFTGPRDMSP